MENITQYRRVGWDFDETLHDHPSSQQFWDYINANPHDQEHFIVTFRTGRLLDRLWLDLARAGCRLLPLHFRGVHGVPEEIYEAFTIGLKGGDRYLYWKGEICHQLGIECLIDDASLQVWPGCARYGINYYHPDGVILAPVAQDHG